MVVAVKEADSVAVNVVEVAAEEVNLTVAAVVTLDHSEVAAAMVDSEVAVETVGEEADEEMAVSEVVVAAEAVLHEEMARRWPSVDHLPVDQASFCEYLCI